LEILSITLLPVNFKKFTVFIFVDTVNPDDSIKFKFL
jgi:hypothetical protein